MPRVGFVEMTPEQRPADTARNRAEQTAPDRITKQGATRSTGDRANRPVSATTAMIIISVMAAVDMMTRERGRGQHSRYGDHCGHRGNRNLILHVIAHLDGSSNQPASGSR